MRRRTWIIVTAVVAVLALGAIAASAGGRGPLEVTSAKAKRGAISEVVTASGMVQADRVMPVVAEFGGEVERVLVKEGSRVHKDQDVVELDGASDAESPIKGRVVSVSVAKGQQTAPGTVLMQVADMRPTYVIAKVDETDIAKVKRGQLVRIYLDAYPDKTVRGRVVSISSVSTVTEGGGTAFPVKIKVTKKAKGVTMRLGMNADVDIVVKVHRSAVLLPVESVTTAGQKDRVFVLEDGEVRAETVKLGVSTDAYYEALEGVSAGDRLATSGLDKLTDGMKVRVKN